MKATYAQALLHKLPGVEWCISENDYDSLVMHKGDPKPSKEQLDAWVEEVTPIILSKQYIDKRAYEYPPIEDQLDMIWHAMNDGLLNKSNEFYKAIKAIKDKYPKEAKPADKLSSYVID